MTIVDGDVPYKKELVTDSVMLSACERVAEVAAVGIAGIQVIKTSVLVRRIVTIAVVASVGKAR
jgi:hypothetical protein